MKIKKSDYAKLTKAFFQGVREGVAFYSQLHCGVQYVSYGKTLQEALDEINADEQKSLLAIKEKSIIEGKLESIL